MGTEVFARGRNPALRLVGSTAADDRNNIKNRTIRVLLAEDDRITRSLAKLLLRRAGYMVFVAANGRDAVDAVEKHNVDIVLMDIVMPVMDGIEASTLIRRLPKPKGDVPIIAVTAHPLEEVRGRCDAAGINAQISKPYQQDLLVQAIEAQLAGRSAGGVISLPQPAASSQDAVALDRHQLGTLESALGRDEVRVLISSYRFNADARLNLLEMCMLNGDNECVSRQAHAIVGMAGNVGAKEVGNAAYVLEKASREGGNTEAATLVQNLAAALKKSFVALSAWQSLPGAGVREKVVRKAQKFGGRQNFRH